MSALDDRLCEIAVVPVLLVASDYDGTLAPIVDDPAKASPHREAIVAARMIAALPQSHVAIISGRALSDLSSLTGLPEDVHLVGSHGSEFDADFPGALPPQAKTLRDRLADELGAIAADDDGLLIEEKPAAVALHYRNASPEAADRAVRAAVDGPGALEGILTKHGKKVVELCVVPMSKGAALETIRHRCGASATIYFGDDLTDEDAFATLTGPDIAVKVGPGESIAPFRVDGPVEVARLMAKLGELRAAWLEGAEGVPIEQHSVLSDQRTIALVTRSGRVNWMCAPRVDSPALFAELLGGAAAGHFTVRPADGEETPDEQAYLDDTLVLRTRWPNLVVTDLLDCSGGRPAQRAGRTDLIRLVEGPGAAIVEFAPRLDFGRAATRLVLRDNGLEVEDALDPIVLRSPGVSWTITQEGAHHVARAEVRPGDRPVILELRFGTGSLREGTSIDDRVSRTQDVWSDWSEGLSLPSIADALVRRSALVLKALCHGPSGAIVAAGTTSLPEHVGGVRNWDYRYCWLRDAAMSAASLVRLGSTDEAMAFLNWMLDVLDRCESPERLHPLYTVTGGEPGPEAEIAELSGYRASRPVRVGNAAARQVQLDVFGPIVELISMLAERDAPLSSDHWRIVEAMVQAVERRWHRRDHGIWEIRRPMRHHVHSKVMCWLAVDRANHVADRFFDRHRPDWVDLRDRIAADVLAKGFKTEVNAFTAAYDGVDLDAATLELGLRGLLPPDDERFVSTVEAIDRALRNGPTVYRYRADDGLPGFEGGFHLCTGWLIEAYVRLGRIDDAHELFEQFCALAGPTGMLSEQWGPRRRRSLGNTPQAYSHLVVIDAAVCLDAVTKG